jgi:hypothetical protein
MALNHTAPNSPPTRGLQPPYRRRPLPTVGAVVPTAAARSWHQAAAMADSTPVARRWRHAWLRPALSWERA